MVSTITEPVEWEKFKKDMNKEIKDEKKLLRRYEGFYE